MDELTELALSARDGNRMALGALIRKTQPDVWRMCRHTGPRGMEDDLTQEVYIRMMRVLPSFRGDSSFRTWLLSIARFTSIDALRGRQRYERLAQLLPRPSFEDPNQISDLAALLDQLDANQRTAFVLTQVLGLSYEEAAEASGCAVGTIRSRVARARGKLIVALQDEAHASNHTAPS